MSEAGKVARGVYRHNKTGHRYEVIGEALHTETNELLVLYRPLYESSHELYARPRSMFVELVTINGQRVPRFEPVDQPRTFIV